MQDKIILERVESNFTVQEALHQKLIYITNKWGSCFVEGIDILFLINFFIMSLECEVLYALWSLYQNNLISLE